MTTTEAPTLSPAQAAGLPPASFTTHGQLVPGDLLRMLANNSTGRIVSAAVLSVVERPDGLLEIHTSNGRIVRPADSVAITRNAA